MNYKRAIIALLLVLTLSLAGSGITFAHSITLAPTTQSVVTPTASPAVSSQASGRNSGEGVAIWVAIGVAVFAAVVVGSTTRRKTRHL